METIKLSEVEKNKESAATSGYVAVNSYYDKPDWDCVESDGPQPTVEDAIAKAREYDWEPPFYIAKVEIVAEVVD
jgi:NAD(P)H-flavin reductase